MRIATNLFKLQQLTYTCYQQNSGKPNFRYQLIGLQL
jgi:hypothetical protein